MIICIETSTPVCSVALCSPSGVIAVRENTEGKSHAALLTLFIEDLLKKTGSRVEDLEAVAVSKGPGSYTGLRIGVSVAKGMAYAASIPLIGVETPVSMFYGIIDKTGKKYQGDDNTLFCPLIDARRMEVYNAIFDSSGNKFRETTAEVIEENSFIEIPEENRLIFFGDGAIKCREVMRRKNIHFEDDYLISATSMHKPAYKAIIEKNYEDIAYFEPFYLKDFIATKQVKSISGR